REIQQFASGKTQEYQWDRAKVSAALTAEQSALLTRRGVLSPEEIHRLAGKTRKTLGAEQGKASCHSDLVSSSEAQHIQIVQLGGS
ncbi:MAG: thiamine biosynthesis protein ThiC, partial [Planctomycetaceae bacterium]